MNRLQGETSPYLLQHADDPVEWHPWDEEALKLARDENKPILLSIGYAACHSCQRMAHESFQSFNVAKMMNDDFINIKVDREERPDLDRIYQTAHGILTRKPGGWPLTMFLDPHDQLPFYGGTYFPPQARKDAPGFREVLRGMAKTYTTQYEKIQGFKTQFHDALKQTLGGGEPGELDSSLVDRACGQIDSSFDEQHGGFSSAPKFPHPAGLELLLDVAASADSDEKSKRALHMLDTTLLAMSHGGIYDHLGGGFFGFSVDADWTIPHFEKMLFDNGPLLSVYARRARQTNSPWLLRVANQTADWLLREMQLEHGGFATSLAADLDGQEGGFYLWRRDDIGTVLGDDYDAFAERYGLTKRPNFGAEWHLRLKQSSDTLALDENPVAGIESSIDALFAAREQREHPQRDDKVVVSWNALAIRGLADAGQQLEREDCVLAATGAVDYLQRVHWQQGRLLGVSRDGKAYLNAYLDDYAFLLDALLSLLAVRWRDADLAFVTALADAMLEHYEDTDKGGFFFTANDHESLLQRPKAFADETMPAGNAMAIRGLKELGGLLGDPRYLEAGERALLSGMTAADAWPSAHASLMRALLERTAPDVRIVLRYSSDDAVAPWLAVARTRLSGRARCYAVPSEADILPQRSALDGAAVTAYVWRMNEADTVVTDPAEFDNILSQAGVSKSA